MKKIIFLPIIVAFCLTGCSKDDPDSDDKDAETVMNENIQLPPASFTVDPDTMTQSTDVTLTPSPEGTMGLNTEEPLTTNIGFTAINGATVVAGGIRFGDSGPVQMVPVNTNGAASGTLNIPFSISQSTCDDIASICHAVKCYEFAMTADGKITAANIMDVALLCGACNEPSCQAFCCPSEGLKIISNSVTIDGVQSTWGSCDPQIDFGGVNGFWSSRGDEQINVHVEVDDQTFSEGLVITMDTLGFQGNIEDVGNGSVVIYLPDNIDGTSGEILMGHRVSVSQGNVVITDYIEGVDSDGDVAIDKMTLTFNSVICEATWTTNRRTLNGSITVQRQ